MLLFIVLDRQNRIRGFPYVERAMAEKAVEEADTTWNALGPHRIVRFVPEGPELTVSARS